MASAISSAGVRVRPLPATCGASTPRSGDGRSTDVRGLRLFPLPAPDAVFPVPQDALLWTYWRSPGSVGEVFGGAALARSGEATGSQFVTLACSHGCAWLPVKRQGANLHEVLRFQHSPAPFASNGRTALFFWAVLFFQARRICAASPTPAIQFCCDANTALFQ